ncbi:MAG: hypothetical protein EBR82_17420 [Caulobacteraceae bacterium]|nr:hypothetical protein [Caulobacteraceae bacterium]
MPTVAKNHIGAKGSSGKAGQLGKATSTEEVVAVANIGKPLAVLIQDTVQAFYLSSSGKVFFATYCHAVELGYQLLFFVGDALDGILYLIPVDKYAYLPPCHLCG